MEGILRDDELRVPRCKFHVASSTLQVTRYGLQVVLILSFRLVRNRSGLPEETDIMTLEESLQWVADLFEEPVENIKPETARDEIEAWDSLGILTLLAGLNEHFDIVLSTDEIVGLRNVNDILDIFRRNGKLD
jgi:acyl carrier protein